MTNLFSSFDPILSNTIILFGGNWLSLCIPIMLLFQPYWCLNSQILITIYVLVDMLRVELSAVFGPGNIQGNIYLFSCVFLYILYTNTIGLVPYIFTGRSHLVYTLSLALPMWLGTMLWAIINQYNSVIAHLVPLGTPNILIPVIVVIESVRNIIRPLTLSVRLAANMVAGHLLLSLIGSQLARVSTMVLLIVILGIVLLISLEIAVACIQSYVFTILNSLYLKEVSTEYLNKSNI